ncbi:MAG: glycosyltransferase [Candidatus Omnitrophica bacterium]|nr:glycosyltransferase [Candidatus Omnitrophota bacterium]
MFDNDIGLSARPAVSIIIAVWNQLGYTKLTTESLIKNTRRPFEIIIIDNGSRPDVKAYFDTLRPVLDIKYIRNDTNLGPIRAINQGIKAATNKYIAAIHNDVVIFEDDWLGKITSVMEKDPTIGLAGLAGRKEIYRTGCVNEATTKHNLQNEEDLGPPMQEDVSEVAVLDGLCLVFRRELLDKVGGLDESYGYMHCYDLDISLQSIAAGYKNVVVKVEAMHVGNGGRTRNMKGYKYIVKDDYKLLKKNCKILGK